MVKVSFPFSVKYGGKFHSPSETLDVAENEVDELVALGAKVLATSSETPKKESEASEDKPGSKAPPAKKEK